MFVLKPFEKLINDYLASDAETGALLVSLEKKTIAIDFEGALEKNIYISVIQNKIELSSDPETQADATISGSPINLLALLISKEKTSLPKSIKIQGDFHLIQTLHEVTQKLNIDWENYIAKYIGPVGAHHIEKAFRGLKAFGKAMKESFELNARDYVLHEKKWVPTPGELNHFYRDVDQLHLAIERLSAKINHYRESHEKA